MYHRNPGKIERELREIGRKKHMTIGTALIGLAMLVFAGIVVTQPLQSRSRRPRLDTTVSSGRDYEAMLLALRDLELDHELGLSRQQNMRSCEHSLCLRQRRHCSKLSKLSGVWMRLSKRSRARTPTAEKPDYQLPDCRQPVAVDDKFCAACGIPCLRQNRKRMMRQISIFITALALTFLTAVPLMAQEETLPAGTVSGQITNLTPDGIVPTNLDVMLHAWDSGFDEKAMQNGLSDADGRFAFESVPLNPAWVLCRDAYL